VYWLLNFESIFEAAEIGKLSVKDKVRLARLKLERAARMLYASQPRLRADDIFMQISALRW